MTDPAFDVHGSYAVTWRIQPPTPLEVWLAENFCHGRGHVLSHRAVLFAKRLDQSLPRGFSGAEGSLGLRLMEVDCIDSFESLAAHLPYASWLVVFRALRNALQRTGQPWMPNLVTDVGISQSRKAAPRSPCALDRILRCRLSSDESNAILDAISHLVLYGYVTALRRRVEKGQSLWLTSMARYITGRVKEADLVTDGHDLEPDIQSSDSRIETPTPTTLRFAEDDDLDVVPLWFGYPARAFDDGRLFGDPRYCNPWWLGYMSFARSFPSDIPNGSPADLKRVRALLETTPALVRSEMTRWGTRLGLLTASEKSLRHVPVGDLVELSRGLVLDCDADDPYLIDIGAASSFLLRLFDSPAGGSGANAAAKRFELLVQEAVDFTPWRPTGALRRLIGRKVRDRAGQVITDIDAVAVRGDVLILIDCKNHREIQDTFIDVRNRRCAYQDQAARWNEKCQRISEVRELLGIDASMRIDGLVVVPKAAFMDSGPATEQVAGMSRVVGIWDMYHHLLR